MVEVDTPVIIALRYPLKVEVVPDPAITTPERDAVTPAPITAPAVTKLVVAIPTIWSALSSIKQTFNPFAQDPGFFAAYV